MSALAVEDNMYATDDSIGGPLDRTDSALLAHVDDLVAAVDEVQDVTLDTVLHDAGVDFSDYLGDIDDGLAADDRHGPLASLCSKFHAIITGRAAEILLEDVDALPEQAGLWAAPSWAWVHSRVNVGRKERASDGSRLRLPVRVEWSSSPVVLVEQGAEHHLAWAAAGLGHTGSGEVPVSASMSLWEPQIVAAASDVPTAVTVPVLYRDEIVRELHQMVAAGKTARWETLSYLEPYISKALHAAHANVANELAQQWGDRQVLLDETKLEAIRNRMLLGDDDHPGKVSQLLDRCLRPDAFKKVEPIKYIKEALRVDANTEIRNALGDPHIGPKIRKVARETGLTTVADVDALVEEYRSRYPKDRLSRDRAVAAMSVAPDVMASWWGLAAFNGG